MATIAEEFVAIAVEQGYDGPTPNTIAESIDAVTTALGGEPSGGTIAQAIAALGENVGGGSGGGLEPVALSNMITINGNIIMGGSSYPAQVLLGDTYVTYDDYMSRDALVFGGSNCLYVFVQVGMHVSIPFPCSSGTTANVTAKVMDNTNMPIRTEVGDFEDFTVESYNDGKVIQFVVPDGLTSDNSIDFTVTLLTSS